MEAFLTVVAICRWMPREGMEGGGIEGLIEGSGWDNAWILDGAIGCALGTEGGYLVSSLPCALVLLFLCCFAPFPPYSFIPLLPCSFIAWFFRSLSPLRLSRLGPSWLTGSLLVSCADGK